MRKLASTWALYLLVVLPAIAPADDWPTWRGPRLDGISTETGWVAEWSEDGPKVAWRKDIGTGYAAIVVQGDRVFAMGFEKDAAADVKEDHDAKTQSIGYETIFCFNADDGAELWRHRYPARTNVYLNAGGPASTPTVYHDQLYTLSRDGQLRCLNARTGTLIWKATIKQLTGRDVQGWWSCSSGVIDGNRIIYQHGGAVVINRLTGRLVLKSPDHPPGYSTPALYRLGKKKRAAIFHAAGLCLVDVQSGRELDNYPWEAAYDIHSATPIVSDGGKKVFASSGYGKGSILFDVSADKLKPIWGSSAEPNRNMRNPMSGCVLHNGHLYGFDENHLSCVDMETGEKAWSHRSRKLNKKGAVMMAGGKLLAIDGDGMLAVVEATPHKFHLISVAKVLDKICWTMPTLANGRIYCRNDIGDMVCIDVRTGG